MKKLDSKNINRRGADAYMDVGGTIPWMESVESSREQRPRAMHGAIAETLRKSFIVGDAINAGANEIAPAKNINNQESSAPLRLCG